MDNGLLGPPGGPRGPVGLSRVLNVLKIEGNEQKIFSMSSILTHQISASSVGRDTGG